MPLLLHLQSIKILEMQIFLLWLMLVKEDESAYEKKNGKVYYLLLLLVFSFCFFPSFLRWIFRLVTTHFFSFLLITLSWFVFSRMASSKICTSESILPSRYQIRERFFTLGNDFKIKDESGHYKYIVRSKEWTLRKKACSWRYKWKASSRKKQQLNYIYIYTLIF